MLGGIAMTYYVLAFLVAERRRDIDAEYRRAMRADPIRVVFGRAFIALGERLLHVTVVFDDPLVDR